MDSSPLKKEISSSGKPKLQYVPRYSYPNNENAIVDDNQNPSTPSSSQFNHLDTANLSPTTGRNKMTEQLLAVQNNSNHQKSNSFTYKSGRRQRPKSLYADLDSYINNTPPILITKTSQESFNNNSNSNNETPTLNSLINQEQDSNFPLSPPSLNKPGNRSSIYSLNSNHSSKFSRSNSRSETESFNNNGSEIFFNSRSGSPVRNSPVKSYFNNNNNSANVLQKPAHRKGHKYKHSSVSMNFFQEPKKTKNLNIPSSLPIPTIKEFFESCNNIQNFKIFLGAFHFFFGSMIFLIGFKYSLNYLITLSHLILFDSISNLLIIIVEIFKNFEIWEKSSIKLPFGLSRIEILFKFSLGISLFYVGFDLITHVFEEFTISLIDKDFNHENHHNHNNHDDNDHDKKLSMFSYNLIIFCGICLTLLTNQILTNTNNHRISNEKTLNNKKSNLDLLLPKTNNYKKFQSILTNYFKSFSSIKLLTLVYQVYLIFHPVIETYLNITELQTFSLSLIILYLSSSHLKELSKILLISYPFNSKNFNKFSKKLMEKIIQLNSFKSNYVIKKILFTKINNDLFLVLLKIKMFGGSESDEYNLRSDIENLIKNELVVLNNNNKFSYDLTIDIDRM